MLTRVDDHVVCYCKAAVAQEVDDDLSVISNCFSNSG